MTKTILVCGGRDFADRHLLVRTLESICIDRNWQLPPADDGNTLPDVVIINGGAHGADRMSTDWAIVNFCSFREYRADWIAHGKAAGPIRNQQMLDEEHPDLVVAFLGGRGTADMVRRAKRAGIEVVEAG